MQLKIAETWNHMNWGFVWVARLAIANGVIIENVTIVNATIVNAFVLNHASAAAIIIISSSGNATAFSCPSQTYSHLLLAFAFSTLCCLCLRLYMHTSSNGDWLLNKTTSLFFTWWKIIDRGRYSLGSTQPHTHHDDNHRTNLPRWILTKRPLRNTPRRNQKKHFTAQKSMHQNQPAFHIRNTNGWKKQTNVCDRAGRCNKQQKVKTWNCWCLASMRHLASFKKDTKLHRVANCAWRAAHARDAPREKHPAELRVLGAAFSLWGRQITIIGLPNFLCKKSGGITGARLAVSWSLFLLWVPQTFCTKNFGGITACASKSQLHGLKQIGMLCPPCLLVRLLCGLLSAPPSHMCPLWARASRDCTLTAKSAATSL